MKKLLTIFALMLVAFTTNAQSCPDNHHPHLIDLGLPSGTKWACCNIGAEKPEGYGGYYAWGETEEKDIYDWNTYIHCDGTKNTCHDLGGDIAGTQYDVAHVKWSGNWVMPTKDQILELYDNCNYEWINLNGVEGGRFTSKDNNACIFLPAAGFRWYDTIESVGFEGDYWSSLLAKNHPYETYGMYLCSIEAYWAQASRCSGHTIRPVATASSFNTPLSTIRGDVNGDKVIDINDVAMTVSHILGVIENDYLVKNADVNGDGDITVNDVMTTINIILTGKGVSSVELPEEAGITASDLTIYSDGEQVDVGENGTLGACIGDMMAFNGDSLVYLSYGSQNDDRTLNSLETAISLLLPIIPFAVTDMDDDSFWLLKQMIGRLEQTRELASAIDQSIIDKGYLNMDAINPQYLAAVAELERRLGVYDSAPANSHMKKTKKTANPFFVYGDKEAYGDGFTLVKDRSIWGKGKKGDCWKCEFTLFNADRWCYTSLTKARKNERGSFNRMDDSFSDTFANLIKPMNVSAFMDWGIFSDLATNPKDFLKTLSDADFDRFVSMVWDPLRNLGHVLRGEETETSAFDKIKKSGIEFDLYPDNEHLMVVGPDIDENLLFFNIVKIVFQPVMKMIMKEVVKTEGYEKSDLEDQLFVQFVKYVSEMDVTFRAEQIAIMGNSDLSWYERITTVWDNINEKMSMFLVKDVILNYFSEALYEDIFSDLAKGYNDPQIKALFTVYKTVLTAGDILLFMLDSQYHGVAFELDYGPSYENYHERHYENYTVSGVTFTMMKLPGGPFMMGAEDSDKQADGNEKPLHYVNLNKFAIGETEVTQGLWKAVMGTNPSKFQGDNKPVDNVSWLDCQEFITKLNQLTGRTFRLPTEAEWEFAACGGLYKRGYLYAGGNDADEVAWCNDEGKETHFVRLKKANEFGLYDMSGNVMEWCQDFYDAHYYDNSPEDNPCNDVTATLYSRVLRGGNWHWDAKYCRVTSRTNNGQGVKSEIYGLRLAMDVSDTPQSYLTCPDNNHPHLIDLGLPTGTLWACCNVDDDHSKQSPTNYGSYYAWGETKEHEDLIYNWSTYIHCDGSYNTGHDLGSDIAGTNYDVAHYQWGGSWMMPSREQQKELWDNCSSTWTTQNGVKGRVFTGSNGGSIFLPAAGFRWDGDLESINRDGLYWSCNQLSLDDAYHQGFDIGGLVYVLGNGGRAGGKSVRPVAIGPSETPLQLSESSIVMAEGTNTTIDIIFGTGSYTVSSSNENVATTTLDGSSMTISAVGGGSTTIIVIDTKRCKTASIEVIVKPLCPDEHHPHMIDLGLPSGTKWACCNVDTKHPENQSPTNYGGHYAWGEIDVKQLYNRENYKYYDNGNFVDIGSDIAGTQYDVAHMRWGGSWVMPSLDQIQELIDNCTYEWTTVNGVEGGKFIAKNSSSIFLPPTGVWMPGYGYSYNSGFDAEYRSSTQIPPDKAYMFFFRKYGVPAEVKWDSRVEGVSVRPVSR